MKKKFCAERNKVVHAKVCLGCGNLRELQLQQEGLERKVWDCEHLFLKSVFVGPATDQWIRKSERDNLPVGEMRKYQYTHGDMEFYL